MAKTVFWSWQSDLDGRVTREVIRFALDKALAILAADLEEADRPSLTSDTQGVAGTPDIVATILRKIDEAAVFVGDVTPIALSDSGKACANPNVLLEMGYANKALTEHRVIQVWNTAFAGATLDALPFDMRGRRSTTRSRTRIRLIPRVYLQSRGRGGESRQPPATSGSDPQGQAEPRFQPCPNRASCELHNISLS